MLLAVHQAAERKDFAAIKTEPGKRAGELVLAGINQFGFWA